MKRTFPARAQILDATDALRMESPSVVFYRRKAYVSGKGIYGVIDCAGDALALPLLVPHATQEGVWDPASLSRIKDIAAHTSQRNHTFVRGSIALLLSCLQEQKIRDTKRYPTHFYQEKNHTVACSFCKKDKPNSFFFGTMREDFADCYVSSYHLEKVLRCAATGCTKIRLSTSDANHVLFVFLSAQGRSVWSLPKINIE